MAKLTVVTGVLLVLIGVTGFVKTGSNHPTALIPALIGLILMLCGAVANTHDLKRRALWMHIAVMVGLLGFLGTIPGAVATFRLAHGVEYPHPAAVIEKGATCLICLLFVAFCIRNFIETRRARLRAI